METKIALMEEFGFVAEELDFNLEDFSLEELRAKFEEMKATTAHADFALVEQFREELMDALRAETVETCFGDMPRYFYVDCDQSSAEVYCYDMDDWKLYGFSFAVNGDAVTIDFDSKKRKKFAIIDFDEGDQPFAFASMFETATQKYVDNDAQWSQQYQTASETISAMESELGDLREFKIGVEREKAMEVKNGIFAQFEDLVGTDEFEALKEDCDQYEPDVLEEKCYALRGKRNSVAKFSQELKAPKLIVGQTGSNAHDPYNGVFARYGIN